jgi:hypothetical protein
MQKPNQAAELHQKLAIERKVLSGASAMLGKLVDENARQTCQVSVIDSQRRIDFLESELAKLSVDTQVLINLTGKGKSGNPQSNSAVFQQRGSSHSPALVGTPEPDRRPSTLNLFGSLLNQLKPSASSPHNSSPHHSTPNSVRGSQTSLHQPDGEVVGKGPLDFMRFGSELTTVCREWF